MTSGARDVLADPNGRQADGESKHAADLHAPSASGCLLGCAVVVVAAGRSERMGFDKIWTPLLGLPVLGWSIRSLAAAGADQLVIVVSAEHEIQARALLKELGIAGDVVRGGARRRDSVLAGLRAAPGAEWIAVHDAARPLVSEALVRRGVDAARSSGAAVPVLPLADTVKRVNGARVVQTIPRDELRHVQTPQVFRRDLLAWALRSRDDDVTDEAGLIESLGGIVYTFPGDPQNFKLTYPEDLAMMREILRQREQVEEPA